MLMSMLSSPSVYSADKASTKDNSSPATSAWQGEKVKFGAFDQYNFQLDDMECKVVVPENAASERPWGWWARFFVHEPQTDLALLKKGYHVAYVEKRYKALGGSITVISKPGVGHHPHSLKDPQLIVDFIVEHTQD